jgi:uncharacterized RDD family membrane protein YckC
MSAEAPHGRAPTALAPHHLRLFALIVDYLLAVGLLNMGNKLLLGSGWDLRPPPAGVLHPAWLLSALALLLLRDGVAGQSPGKWFTGIAVVRSDDPGTLPRLHALLLRNVTLLVLPVEAVWVFVDPYYRRLGDHLAGTVVVARGRPAPAMRRLLGMAILFLGSTLAIFLLEYWNVRRTAAYPTALHAAQADPGTASLFGSGLELSAPGLARSADGERMRVRLEAKGSAGGGHVEVSLRLAAPPPHWELERVQPVLTEPAKGAKPKVEPAPPR